MSSLSLLPASTVHRIASSQVITSVGTAVKELVENALDAGADNVEVKLEENGLSRIEVRDNGCGIKREDAQVMAQRSYTSKINCFENLNELTTYGFRGEALCSLCAVSNVSITTKTKDNAVAICYTLGQSGKVFSTKPVPSSTGTTIVVTNLFKNLPVRKQFLSSKKKCKEELKKVEELIMSFGCIHPGVRLVLWHNKSIIWQKGKVNDYKTSLVTVLGTPVMSQMDKVQYEDQEYSFQITGYLPKIDSNPSVTCRANNDRCFIFVNERPVLIKEVSQLIKELYSSAGHRYPIVFLSIKLPPDGVDVNLEPNKTRVLLTEKDRILDSIKGMLEKFYKKEIQKDKDGSVSSSEDKETYKIVEHSTDKNSKEIDVIEKRRCASDGQLPCSPNFNIFINSSSTSEHLIDDLKIDDHISPIDSSTLNNVFSIKNGIEESNNLPAKEVSDTDSQEPSEQTPCLFTAMVSGDSIADQHCDSVECAIVNNRELVTITPTSLSAAVIPCNQQIDTTDDIVEESLAAISNSLTLPTISASATQECDKLEGSTDCLVKNTAHKYLSDNTEASNLDVTKETTGINESSQDSNACLDKEDVNNIYRLLDLSEKENHIAFFGEQDTLEFPKPPNEQTVIQQDKDISKKNNGSFDLDNVFNDDLEFDQILQDIAKNKACSQSSQSTQSSEPNTQTAASKLKDLIDSNDKDIWDKDISGKDWSMGNILKDKQENFLEPTKLLTPSTIKPVDQNKTLPTPGKRKHSGDKSLSLRRNKKPRQVHQVSQINQSLITIHASPPPQQRFQQANKVNVPFSMSTLKSSSNSNARSMSSSSPKHRLIGRLEPSGVWLMLKENEISFVNQYRIQEQILFHKLMQTHSLTREKLERSINLEPRLVGGDECWTVLTNLESQIQFIDSTRLIADERITSNGFDIRIKVDPDSDDLKIEVFGITTSLPFYGIPDLAEILGLIKDSDPKTSSLSECRPLKVINYLKGEAVRVCRGLSSRMCREDVERTLTQMDEYLPKHVTSCLHKKPFTGHVASM